MDFGIEEGLVPWSSKTITTPSIADSRNGFLLSMSDVNQFSTQAQEAHSHLSTTPASNSNTAHSHQVSSTTRTPRTLLSLEKSEDDLELSYRGKKKLAAFTPNNF